ncbi:MULTISPECIES: hypothetical protein [unclassified Streptomyces]|uniref:hypothetical protein n=1 Tax=unclassified Streptomyces TaxID=2593676 RepID=UPI0035D6E5B5
MPLNACRAGRGTSRRPPTRAEAELIGRYPEATGGLDRADPGRPWGTHRAPRALRVPDGEPRTIPFTAPPNCGS